MRASDTGCRVTVEHVCGFVLSGFLIERVSLAVQGPVPAGAPTMFATMFATMCRPPRPTVTDHCVGELPPRATGAEYMSDDRTARTFAGFWTLEIEKSQGGEHAPSPVGCRAVRHLLGCPQRPTRMGGSPANRSTDGRSASSTDWWDPAASSASDSSIHTPPCAVHFGDISPGP